MFLEPVRQVFQITGSDRYRFMQGLVTQDVNLLEQGQRTVIYTAALTPNGRYQYDFFLVNNDQALYVVAQDAEALLIHIRPYKLRLDVQFIPLFDTHRVYGNSIPFTGDIISFQDPRHLELGYWCITDRVLSSTTDLTAYRRNRFNLGIPEGEDFEKDRSIILEWGLEELNGISFTKGCYMGQELMSRTKHTGQIRKRLLPCQFDEIHGEIKIGDKVTYKEQEIGEIKAVHGFLALGLMRIDMIPVREEDTVPVVVNQDKAIIYKPQWIKL